MLFHFLATWNPQLSPNLLGIVTLYHYTCGFWWANDFQRSPSFPKEAKEN